MALAGESTETASALKKGREVAVHRELEDEPLTFWLILIFRFMKGWRPQDERG